MTRWKLTIEYNGAPYSGSQRQPDLPTIQGAVEKAVFKFCQKNIEVTFAGRTDAGVHARAQVAHFDLEYKYETGEPRALNGFQLAKALNAHLMAKEAITIVNAIEVDDKFHARFGAKQKQYTYRIISRSHMLSLDKGYAWWVKQELDVGAMRKSAKCLIGEHDFTSFRDAECQAQSPIRSIDEIQIENTLLLNGQEILIHVKGQAFLHHQVRNIAGSLCYVGKGKWEIADMKKRLMPKTEPRAGQPHLLADYIFILSIILKNKNTRMDCFFKGDESSSHMRDSLGSKKEFCL